MACQVVVTTYCSDYRVFRNQLTQTAISDVVAKTKDNMRESVAPVWLEQLFVTLF